jgi:hypothetical protein
MTLITPSKQRQFEEYASLVILRLASSIAVITYLSNLWEPRVTGRSLVQWALLLLPFVWIAVCPRKWIATAVGTALGTFAINAPALLLLLLFFSVAAPKFSSDMIFLVMQIPLLIAALLVWIKEPVAKANIVLPFAVAAFLYYYAADRSPLIGPGHGAGPETTYVVRSVDKCAIQYAAGHQGNYPDDLRELGPNGSGCLSADIARGNSDGLRLAYSRQVKGFQVFADNHSFWRDGRRTVGLMYSDQSGVIRGNVNKDRPGSSGSELYDLEGSVPADLQRAAQCLLKHGQPYPVDLQSLSGPGGCLPAGGTWMREANYLQQYGYVLTYEAKVNPTPGVHAFEINARPVPYGRWGLRSFYVDDNGVVRATPEDRPANTQDPPAR